MNRFIRKTRLVLACMNFAGGLLRLLHSWTWHLTILSAVTQKWTHRYQLKPGRWVFAPTDEAKKTGARTKRSVASHWKPPSFYYHLRKGGHVAAVRSHESSRFFFRADLDDFFGRVNRTRVTRCLKSWFSYAEAREMASESVVKRPGDDAFVLPYGFVQSPML